MYGERSLNIAGSRAGITVSGRRVFDYPGYGKGYYQAESGASGGGEFQHHRSNYNPTYVANAVPTENGYSSVGYEAATLPTLDGTGRLHHVSGCQPQECDLKQYGIGRVRSIVTTPAGELALLQNGTLWRTGSSGLVAPLTVEGVLLANALGAFTIGGRLCLYTEHDVHVSSAENQLDFLPSLRTQAQSFTVRYNIGNIVTATGFGEIAYLWGTRGAVMLQCTGDANIPYAAKMVTDFTGIMHKDNVQVDYAASSIHVWSHSGLVMVQGVQCSPTPFPDISEALREQRLVWFASEDAPAADMLAHIDGLQTVCYDTRDSLRCTQPSTLVKEQVVPCSVVAVREHNQRWLTVSYGSGGVQDAEGNALHKRMLLVDKVLGRLTVLHKLHTDVAATRCGCDGAGGMGNGGYAELAIATPSGCETMLHGKGTALLYYNQMSGTNRKVVKLVSCVLKGDFNLPAYPDVEWRASHVTNASAYGSSVQRASEGADAPALTRILCVAGQDMPGRNALHNLRLLTKTRGDLHYAGCATGHTVSVLATFSGNLTEFILRRSQ